MKINGPNRPNQIKPLQTRNHAPTQGTSKPNAGGERVEVSTEAKVLLEARAPEVPDSATIARIKDAIVTGSFQIHADRIADAMLREEL